MNLLTLFQLSGFAALAWFIVMAEPWIANLWEHFKRRIEYRIRRWRRARDERKRRRGVERRFAAMLAVQGVKQLKQAA